MGERRIFVDTSGLYAWVNKNDPWHQSMCALPAEKNTRLVLSNYIVDEACSLFVTRKIPHQRRRLFHLLDHSAIMQFQWIGADLFNEAKD